MSRMDFELLGTDGAARRGRIRFPRGTIETPAFMPVGTYGSVKGVLPPQIEDLGAEIILGNTFHLFLRPGLEVIEAHGGLHGFARWNKPILTDSGGFQVFSLAHRRKITEQGVTFAAPTDGSKVFLGPEESMRIQKVLGSDIVMIFDECPPVNEGWVISRGAARRYAVPCRGVNAIAFHCMSRIPRAEMGQGSLAAALWTPWLGAFRTVRSLRKTTMPSRLRRRSAELRRTPGWPVRSRFLFQTTPTKGLSRRVCKPNLTP